MLFDGFKLFMGTLFVLGACGCGGDSKPEASSPASATAREGSVDATPSSSDSADGAASAPAPKRAACDDGTCTPCGDALCPNGWYCDETASGGPTCGWLPECAQKSGCACVKKVLGCACEEKAGSAHISCK